MSLERLTCFDAVNLMFGSDLVPIKEANLDLPVTLRLG